MKKRENLDINMQRGRTLCENEGRDLGDVSTSKRTPKIASKPREAR